MADRLIGLGIAASAQDTGGGTICIVVDRNDGGEIIWGTADVTWGASVTDEDGEPVSSLTTEWPSDSQDIEGISEALRKPSLEMALRRCERACFGRA